MGYVQSVLSAIASGLQWVGLRVIDVVWGTITTDPHLAESQKGIALRDVSTDEPDEGPLLVPTLMRASPAIPFALFAATVKLSQSICSKGIVDSEGTVLPQASFYQQSIDFLRREAAFNLLLGLWVGVAESYRAEEEEIPQFLAFFLMTLALELSLNLSASAYDLYAERNGPLRTNFLTKLKHVVLRSTVPSVITAPLIKSISFDILYSRASTSHPWLWMTLAGASTQVPRQIVALFLPRIVNALLTYCHSKKDNEVSQSEMDDEEQQSLLLAPTQIKGIDDSLIIALPWSLLATMTTTLSWDMASLLCTWTYKELQYDKFDNSSLLFLEMTAGATIGIVAINSALAVVMGSRRLRQSQGEITTSEVDTPRQERNQNKNIPNLNLIDLVPASPHNLSDRRKRATVRDTQRQLQVQLGITLITPQHAFDYNQARKLLYEAAKLGDGLAWCYLGFLYEYGLGVTPSLHAAAFCYDKANGDHAFITLVKGVCYLRRLIIGVVSCYEDAVALLREAVYLSVYCELKNWQDTLEFLDRIANIEEDVSANLILALVYELGLLNVAINPGRANDYYERVSERGESWTQYNLGMVYHHKDWPQRNATKAYHWLCLSVQARHKVKEPLYWYNLGVLYRDGLGTPQNYSQAKLCFEEARKLGSTAACEVLVTMYKEGLGCSQNLAEASKCEEESSVQNNNRRSGVVNLLSIEEELPILKLQRKSREINFNSMSGYKELVCVKVLCNFYDSERLDRLPIQKGEILKVYIENKNWLYAVNGQGLEGMVPRNALRLLKRENSVSAEVYQKLSIELIDEKDISHKKILDDGLYTRVSQGFWKEQEIVIKEPQEYAPVEEVQAFAEEGILMAGLDHPNIVKLLAFIEVSPPKLVMEYMLFGSIWKHLHSTEPLFPHEKRREIALNIAQALHYLHGIKILHLDVKSPNVLLNPLCAKLADFGTAIHCGTKLKAYDSKRIGTEDWLSPELRGKADVYVYTAASDVYAYGVFLWELFTYLKAALVKNYLLNKKQSLVPEIPPDIAKLIHSCCAKNSNGRPILSDVVCRLSGQPQSAVMTKKEGKEKEKEKEKEDERGEYRQTSSSEKSVAHSQPKRGDKGWSWGAPKQPDFFSQSSSSSYLNNLPPTQPSESIRTPRAVYSERRRSEPF